MRIRLTLAAAVVGCLAAPWALAIPPGPGHGPGWAPGRPPGVYRPAPPVLAPAYPGWRVAYPRPPYPAPIYPGPRYWAPRVGIAAPGYWGAWPYGGPWPYAVAGAYAVPYAVPYGVAPVVVSVAPPVAQAAPLVVTAPDTAYWYYCPQPAGYHPYVQNCAQAWMRVLPQVPGDASAPRLAP